MQATRTFIDAPLGSPRSEAAAEEDTDLVKEALAGNRWAEEALYYRHVRGVTRVVLRLLSRSSEVEDVVQDTFVIAFGDLAVLADPAAFRHWLIRIAVRQVHRRFRRRKLLRLLGLDASQDDQILAAQADPKAGPETRVLLGEVDRILAKLPIRARVAWVLRNVEGQKLEDVAFACGCSLSTTKRLLSRAGSALSEYASFEASEES